MYHEDYLTAGITTPEFNPELLRRLSQKTYWYISFRSLWRDPRKFFSKYVLRILRPEMLKTLFRIARTLLFS